MSEVFFTKEVSPAGIQRVFEKLNFEPHGKAAVKMTSAEMGNENYLRPEFVKDIVAKFGRTIIEGNTAYGGSRQETSKHIATIKAHGFDQIAEVDILDSEGEIELPIKQHKHLESDCVGSHFANYDSILVVSHFKGHQAGGFGGAMKNIGIGIASSRGKLRQHNAGRGEIEWQRDHTQDEFLESMAEAASAVVDSIGKENIAFINILKDISIDCDCDGNAAPPSQADIGIAASRDPIALDKACYDFIQESPDGDALRARMSEMHAVHTLEYGEQLGIGSQSYNLITLD